MITFDGDRSKKKAWLAEKRIQVLKDNKVPAGCITWDGFTLTSWQSGELSGGRVTAPMGLVLVCTTLEECNLLVADSWTSGFNSKRSLQTFLNGVYEAGLFYTINNGESEAGQTAEGNTTFTVCPTDRKYYYGAVDWQTLGSAYEYLSGTAPAPTTTPLIREGYIVNSAIRHLLDLDEDSSEDYKLTTVESVVNYYSADGGLLSNRFGFSACVKGTIQPVQFMYALPAPRESTRHVHFTFGAYYKIDGETDNTLSSGTAGPISAIGTGDTVIATANTVTTTGAAGRIYTANDFWGELPSGLLTVLAEETPDALDNSMGGYAFSTSQTGAVSVLHPVSCTSASSAAQTWFDTNGQEEWNIFYTFSDDLSVNTVNSDQFIGILHSLSGTSIVTAGVIDWVVARRMMQQLFPWPNPNWLAPYDGAMFHAEDTNVYTWTRNYGAVCFRRDDLVAATVAVPAEVSATEGVRPEIKHISGSDYLCICNNVGNQIDAIYYGSPFDTWTAIPSQPTGYELVYVRPVKYTVSDETPNIVMLGVLKSEEGFYVGFFENGGWKVMAKIPITEVGGEQFDLSFFAVGSHVIDMQDFISPPHVFPQMPVGPYDLYTTSMP